MKSFTKLFLMIVLVSSLFISCSEEDEDVVLGKVKIGDFEYPIYYGYLTNYGTSEEGKTNNYTENNYNGYYQIITFYTEDGNGAPQKSNSVFLKFDLFSTRADELDSRTYSFSDTKPFAIGTFTKESEYVINRIGISINKLSSGSVVVAKSGNEYTLTFNVIGANGIPVTGNYTGQLEFINFDPGVRGS